MSAAATLYEAETIPVPDELEPLEKALDELNHAYARNEIDQGRLLTRRDELLSRVQTLRRKRLDNYLDFYSPPVTFYSIEVGPQTETQRQAQKEHVFSIVLEKFGKETLNA